MQAIMHQPLQSARPGRAVEVVIIPELDRLDRHLEIQESVVEVTKFAAYSSSRESAGLTGPQAEHATGTTTETRSLQSDRR